MITIVPISEFRKNIGIYIEKILYKKEAYLLTKGKRIVAKVVAFDAENKAREPSPLLKLAGIWRGENVEQFKRDLKQMDEASKKDLRSF